jgi:excisionase family DNA binding protein
MSATASHPQYKSVAEVAAEFRVNRRTVYRLVERGELPSARVGSRIRIPVEALEELLRPARRTEENQ